MVRCFGRDDRLNWLFKYSWLPVVQVGLRTRLRQGLSWLWSSFWRRPSRKSIVMRFRAFIHICRTDLLRLGWLGPPLSTKSCVLRLLDVDHQPGLNGLHPLVSSRVLGRLRPSIRVHDSMVPGIIPGLTVLFLMTFWSVE